MKIAITGGIGSGKSTVLSILKKNGFAVFSCDEIYREISKTENYINKVREYFPLVVKQGQIDRKSLGELIFREEQARNKLNQISHPLIIKELFIRMENATGNLVFAEVPLLYETQEKMSFDAVILVARDKEERIKSIVDRDGISISEAKRRISAQVDYDNLSALQQVFRNTFVVSNTTDKNQLERNLLEVIQQIHL